MGVRSVCSNVFFFCFVFFWVKQKNDQNLFPAKKKYRFCYSFYLTRDSVNLNNQNPRWFQPSAYWNQFSFSFWAFANWFFPCSIETQFSKPDQSKRTVFTLIQNAELSVSSMHVYTKRAAVQSSQPVLHFFSENLILRFFFLKCFIFIDYALPKAITLTKTFVLLSFTCDDTNFFRIQLPSKVRIFGTQL